MIEEAELRRVFEVGAQRPSQCTVRGNYPDGRNGHGNILSDGGAALRWPDGRVIVGRPAVGADCDASCWAELRIHIRMVNYIPGGGHGPMGLSSRPDGSRCAGAGALRGEWQCGSMSGMTSSGTASEAGFSIAARLSEMAITSELLAGCDDLAEILKRLAGRAREVTGAGFAAISTFDDNGTLERFIYTGIEEGLARKLGDPPVGRGLLGELARCEHPLRLDDLTRHPSATGWPAGHPEMRAFLGVPIRAGGRTIGSLYMTRDLGGPPFTEAAELSAVTLALQAAVSVASALARERSGRLFLLEERERIAHDLHDGTIQSLYALGLEFDATAAVAASPEVKGSLGNGVARINELIGDIRQYITMLEAETPASQPELTRDLAFVIRQLVPSGVDTVVNITAAALQELTARDAEDLLYIAREALSNSVRHGAVSKVAIDLRQNVNETSLTIQDNGVGFDQANARTGLGTITMRTRAERLGGELSVLGIPGMGTTVRVSIPRRNE
jgi:signal transduction histidine kinase